jgi:membrane protease YdiL (CAAX protease family)
MLLLGGAWLAAVPASALGVAGDPLSTDLPALGVGIAAGVGLSFGNALAGGLAERFDGDPSEELRSLLSPETLGGWVVLLGGVLPVIAGFEELLFRAALIGAFSVGFGVSPWALVVFSSVAFAVGHGAQGRLGIVVTGLLGAALGALFLVTNSLLAVVVAHYLVNAVEFLVGEGLEWRPFE